MVGGERYSGGATKSITWRSFRRYTEVLAVDGEDPTSAMQFCHRNDGGVRKIHLLITPHQRPNSWPVCRSDEVQTKRVAFQHFKQGIDVHLVLPEKTRRFGKHSFADEHWRPHVLHERKAHA